MIIIARKLKSGRGHNPPPTPTNEDRYRTFRDAIPVTLGNARRWPWHKQ